MNIKSIAKEYGFRILISLTVLGMVISLYLFLEKDTWELGFLMIIFSFVLLGILLKPKMEFANYFLFIKSLNKRKVDGKKIVKVKRSL